MPDGCIAALVVWIGVAIIQQIVFCVNYFMSEHGNNAPCDRNQSHYNFSKWFWSLMWSAIWPITAPFSVLFHTYDYAQDK
jgi:hypothetical protein